MRTIEEIRELKKAIEEARYKAIDEYKKGVEELEQSRNENV